MLTKNFNKLAQITNILAQFGEINKVSPEKFITFRGIYIFFVGTSAGYDKRSGAQKRL